MFKLITGLLVVLGLWTGLEFMNEGPSRAFGGLFKDFVAEAPKSPHDSGALRENRTVQRAGAAAIRARDKADARRERMLGE